MPLGVYVGGYVPLCVFVGVGEGVCLWMYVPVSGRVCASVCLHACVWLWERAYASVCMCL